MSEYALPSPVDKIDSWGSPSVLHTSIYFYPVLAILGLNFPMFPMLQQRCSIEQPATYKIKVYFQTSISRPLINCCGCSWVLPSYIAGNDITLYVLCMLVLLTHNIYSMEHVWRIHQSVYITQTLGHVMIHYISFITFTLHILHGGCVMRVSRIHIIYFIEHMWHIPTDVHTTHKSLFMWIHYIYIMVYTQHMHHGGRVMHMWKYYDPRCVLPVP